MESQEVAMVLNADAAGNTYLTGEQIKWAQMAVMEIYHQHLQGEKLFQKDQAEKLQKALKAAKTAFKKAYKAEKKEIKKALPGDEHKRKREEQYKKVLPAIMHSKFDPVVKDYERKAYYGTVSLGLLLSDISNALRTKDLTMGSEVESDKTVVKVGEWRGLGSVHIATYYKLRARFECFHRGKSGRPDVYRHKSFARAEFVTGKYEEFIPRYVIRNLAKRDLPHLQKPPVEISLGMASRDGMVVPNADFDKAVVAHLRAAEQGSSFFVSTTFLTRPIFGATGKDFYNKESGQVLIDLAELPKDRIVNVASKQALKRFMSVDKLCWDLKFKEDDSQYHKMAAARDTVRTGEILIHGRIPREAIVKLRSSKTGGKWIKPKYVRRTYGPPRQEF